jgi:uncharacterized Ntn-hydrolase superfamily protein
MTFSIVAYDAEEHAVGVAVASKFLAVGAIVPYVRADSGAVATQAFAKLGFGPDGLRRIFDGQTATDALAEMLSHDPYAQQRQVGAVDTHGGAAAHTGTGCSPWAGHYVGEAFTCQGNILTGPEVIQAMADAYRSAQGELADRLMTAIQAGDAAGGDKRGRQSAALLVAKPGGGYGGDTDKYLDLRVDDHADPVGELARLLGLHRLYFRRPSPDQLTPVTPEIARELQAVIRRSGHYSGEIDGVWSDAAKSAFWDFVGEENLEERWSLDAEPDMIDTVTLEFIRSSKY